MNPSPKNSPTYVCIYFLVPVTPCSATAGESSSDQSLPASGESSFEQPSSLLPTFQNSSKNKNRMLSKPTGKSRSSFADTLSQKDECEISKSMAQIFFECNIPLLYFRVYSFSKCH